MPWNNFKIKFVVPSKSVKIFFLVLILALLETRVNVFSSGFGNWKRFRIRCHEPLNHSERNVILLNWLLRFDDVFYSVYQIYVFKPVVDIVYILNHLQMLVRRKLFFLLKSFDVVLKVFPRQVNKLQFFFIFAFLRQSAVEPVIDFLVGYLKHVFVNILVVDFDYLHLQLFIIFSKRCCHNQVFIFCLPTEACRKSSVGLKQQTWRKRRSSFYTPKF